MAVIVTDAYPDAVRNGKAYTVLKKIKVEHDGSGSNPFVVNVDHNLGAIPSWVRLTPLGIYDVVHTAYVGNFAVAPIVDTAETDSTGELVWEDQPIGYAAPIDLTQTLAFGGVFPKTLDYYVLVEIGITHSVVR